MKSRKFLKRTNSFTHLLTYSLVMSFFSLPAFSFEDCIIMTNGKLTDIKIQHNDIVDICPLVTISNNKNILIVHPLKTGSTKFSVLKNNKDKSVFTINISDEKTDIGDIEGYEILSVDTPPKNNEYDFDIDEPPIFENVKNNNSDVNINEIVDSIMINPNLLNKINEAVQYRNMIDSLDEPPKLRGEDL